MEKSQRLYQLGLALAIGIGKTTALKLLENVGSAEAIFKEKPQSLLTINGIGRKVIENLSKGAVLHRAEQELEFMEKNQVEMAFIQDSDYPERLSNCCDAPLVIFHKGNLPNKMRHSLSVIGTRDPTSRGREYTVELIRKLASDYPDLYIISGLAYGIDIAAHESALVNEIKTIAVLGHGFHTLYPHIHRSTSEKILESGALITDFFSNNNREPKNFIKRNRIIAGISEATLVIESQLKGGAMATAEMANSYNREVFAVPGRPSDQKSVGCNYLIRNNKALLISHPDDIPYFLDWEKKDMSTKNEHFETQILPDLSESQVKIMDLLTKDELNINELGVLLIKHPAKLTADLLNLEFAGLIIASPGGRFRANSKFLRH